MTKTNEVYVPTTTIYTRDIEETIENMPQGFIDNTTRQDLQSILDNIADVVDWEHVADPETLGDNEFGYNQGLDDGGYYLLPDGEFDYGDTQSNGVMLVGVDPRNDKQAFKDMLYMTVKTIIDTLYSEDKQAEVANKAVFILTEDDVKTVAQDNGYSEEALQSVMATLLHGDIDFDWYETIDDLLDTAENK